ncbi:MAG: Pantothenate synthetase [Verrucomicrobiaceae bacterium]|nr:Pantothenate synthetase [Verrucomicrobiaceae bacterium]
MQIFHLESELRDWRRNAGTRRVVLVPTMGALHEGHVHLVRVAREMAGPDGFVAVSIFVNPLQFGPKEDFSRYPRDLEADAAKCEEAGADVIFAPDVAEVYAPDRSTIILEKSLSHMLCGASRPGHFDGVCTVVAKLFNYFQPDDAVFGKKDYQQLAIIRRMVRDLSFPVAVHGIETVREDDGLAMSSRNRYLTEEERRQAPALREALQKARGTWAGGVTGTARLIEVAREHLEEHAPLGRIDYLSVVDADSLHPLDVVEDQGLMAVAVFFGKARLIDNLELLPMPD